MTERKGHFSSRVLNMKFMRTAEKKEGLKLEEEQKKRLKDLSEWKLGGSEELIDQIKRRQPKVTILSYTAIHSLENRGGVSGKRTFTNEGDKAQEIDSAKGEKMSENEGDDPMEEKSTELQENFHNESIGYKDGPNSAKNLLELWAAKNKKKTQRGVRKPRK